MPNIRTIDIEDIFCVKRGDVLKCVSTERYFTEGKFYVVVDVDYDDKEKPFKLVDDDDDYSWIGDIASFELLTEDEQDNETPSKPYTLSVKLSSSVNSMNSTIDLSFDSEKDVTETFVALLQQVSSK